MYGLLERKTDAPRPAALHRCPCVGKKDDLDSGLLGEAERDMMAALAQGWMSGKDSGTSYEQVIVECWCSRCLSESTRFPPRGKLQELVIETYSPL